MVASRNGGAASCDNSSPKEINFEASAKKACEKGDQKSRQEDGKEIVGN